MKSFALNTDLKELYDKVVPPVALVETQVHNMSQSVSKFKKIVARYDELLSQKASKQDVNEID